MDLRTIELTIARPAEKEFARFGKLVALPEAAPSVDVPGVLTYWDQVVNLNFGEGGAELGFLVTRRRPLTFTSMERHTKSDESFIPLNGRPFLFALAPASGKGEPGEVPDPDQVRVFFCDGSYGVNLDAGVWHWAPFPFDESASFVLALRKGTVEEDIDLKDLERELGVRFSIRL